MVNLQQILKNIDIELTDEQFNKIKDQFNENYVVKNEYSRMKEKFEKAEQSRKDIQSTFDDFKKNFDGVDIDELKGKVDTLTQQLADKDNDYQKKLGTIELNSKIKDGLRERNCIDLDLAMTQFDIDQLLASKNQDKDLETALNAVVENKKMLFQQEPKPEGNINIGGGTGGNGDTTHDNLLRQAMGLEVKGD